jgi:hypothetical protein
VNRSPAAPVTNPSAVAGPPISKAPAPPTGGAAELVPDVPPVLPLPLTQGSPGNTQPVLETITNGLPGYAFPFGLALLIVVYLVAQHFLDRRDPKLRDAPFERIDALRPFSDGP